jgi:hypothetical protein
MKNASNSGKKYWTGSRQRAARYNRKRLRASINEKRVKLSLWRKRHWSRMWDKWEAALMKELALL